jgi:hypothetical protein
VLTPDAERGFSPQPALGDFQGDEFVLAIFETRLGGVIGLHVGQHFRIFHNLSSVAR